MRYNIFAGTNNWSEFINAFFDWITNRYEDYQLINKYEDKFAEKCNVKHGISFGSGRMALYAILESLNINEGDEVIIPAYTCIVVSNAIIYRGAIPIYVDINYYDFNIDTSLIESAITSKTKALYAQHTFGYPCNIDEIKQIALKHKLPVIEDAAHALGMKYNNEYAGSLTEVAFFSTDHSKIINTLSGGIAVTNNDTIANKLKEIQNRSSFLSKKKMRKQVQTFLFEQIFFHPFLYKLGKLLFSILYKLNLFYFHNDELLLNKPVQYPCKMSSALARIGISQLNNLEINLSYRKKIASLINNKINWYNLNDIRFNDSVWLRFSFLINNRKILEKSVFSKFELSFWFTSVLQGRNTDFDKVFYKLGSCPKAEFVSDHIFNLPTHQRISYNYIAKILNKNHQIINNSKINF